MNIRNRWKLLCIWNDKEYLDYHSGNYGKEGGSTF